MSLNSNYIIPIDRRKSSRLIALLIVLFFTGLILTGFSMNLYDDTMMPLAVALSLLIGPGVLITPFFYNMVAAQRPGRIFSGMLSILVINIFAWGGITLYAFMAVNYYNADKNTVYITLPLISKEYVGGKYPRNLVKVDYKSKLIKQFEFDRDLNIKEYHALMLKTSAGYLGFDVVREQTLLK